MNKKFFILIIFILLLIAGGVFWWWQRGKEATKGVEEKPSVSVAETTKTTGRIIPPSGIDPRSFTITSLTETTTPDSNGNFEGKIYKEGVSLIAAMPTEGKGHELMAVVISSQGVPETPLILDTKSTAVAIVFFTPFIMTNEPDETREMLKIIQQDPKVQEFAKVIETLFTKEDFMNDPLYQKAFKEATESVLNTLNP